MGPAAMHREEEIDFGLSRVAGFGPGVAVGLEVRLERDERAAAHRDEERIAEPAERWEGVLACPGDADRRGRVLLGPRRRPGPVPSLVLPPPARCFVCPPPP